MRTLNVKLAVVFLTAVIVIAGSTHLLHVYQLHRKSSSFKTQAEAAWNDTPKRYLDAITLMRVYLLLDPKDYEAREELGFWYAATGRFSEASMALEELVRALEEQNPPDVPTIQRVRQKLIDAAMAQGRCADAVYHLEILRKELPSDVDVLNRLGKCKVTLGREEEAIRNFSEAIQMRPDRFDIWYNKAMVLRFPPVQKLAEAEKCMADMIKVEANAKSAVAHHVYGLWLQELADAQHDEKKYQEALRQAETTLALAKDHRGALYLAGQSELALRHFVKAEEYARRGMAAAPQDFVMYTLMADVHVRNNKRGKAIEVLKNGIEVCRSKGAKAQILWHLANLYLDIRGSEGATNVAEAVDCMRRMRDYHFSPVQMAFLDARVSYANDDWKSARVGFEKVRAKLNDFPQLMKCLDYWTGYCYLQQGNPDQAMAAFRRSLSFDKFYFKAHDGIAQIFVNKGQLADAAEEYRQAASGNPFDADAWLAFARALVVWNVHRSPTMQNWDDVDRAIQHGEDLDPLEGQLKLLKVDSLFNRGRVKEAEGLLRTLHENSPKGVEFQVAQANLAGRQGEFDQARKILNETKAKLGDHVLIRLTQSVILLRELNLQAGNEIEKLADDVDRVSTAQKEIFRAFSPAEKVRLWNGLVKNLLEIKEYDRAKRLCRRIASLQPHDATVRYQLLELALVTHDARNPAASLAELDRVLEEIDNIAGQGPLSLYGKAVRLKLEAGQGKPELLDKAMDCAKEAQKLRLAWSRPDVLMGEICRQRGNDEEALGYYLQASVNGDRDLEFIRLLLQMLYERQHYDEAQQVIHRLDSNETLLTPDIKEYVAVILASGGEFDRALEAANEAYDPASDDYRDHVWHGQVLKLLAGRAQREGHQEKVAEIAQRAEKSLRRACQIAPNRAECRVELVQLLAATNQMDKAHVAADDAREMIPLGSSPLAMGYIHEALGETKQAGESYEKALKLRPDFLLAIRVLADFYVRNQDFQHATPLIQRLLDGKVQASESDLMAVRRMKVIILEKQGYSKLKEATDLIDRNLASSLASPEDKRLKVRLLLADPRRARSPELLELEESLVRTGEAEPNPADRFQLASLYLALGEWERCQNQMAKLVNGGQCDPGYLAVYVRMLLDREQLNDAELWLDRLEHVSNPGQAVAFRADLLFRRKHWSEVPDFLDAYVSQAKADSKDRLDRVLLAARLLDDFGGRLTAPTVKRQAENYFEKARAGYESYVRQHPGSELLLARFDARRGKVEDALQGIERYGEQSVPQDVAEVVGAIVSGPQTNPSQLKRLEAVVVALLDKTHRPTPLLIGLAEIQSAQDRPQDSEKIYREILEKDPRDDLACNNLSMILALQKTKLDEALELIDKTIQRAGPQGPFLDTRAVVSIARREPGRALEDLELALAERKTPLRLFHKAWAYHESAMDNKAKESLQLARNAGLEDSMLARPEREIRGQIGKEK